MKAFTDIEQSKNLAKILPIESADMCYRIVAYNPNDTHVYQPYCFAGTLESDIPCWSLAALIELTDECRMEKTQLYQTGKFTYSFIDDYNNIHTHEEDNPVDACYEMIIKLHEPDAL